LRFLLLELEEGDFLEAEPVEEQSLWLSLGCVCTREDGPPPPPPPTPTTFSFNLRRILLLLLTSFPTATRHPLT
jgi:hypothetical protein